MQLTEVKALIEAAKRTKMLRDTNLLRETIEQQQDEVKDKKLKLEALSAQINQEQKARGEAVAMLADLQSLTDIVGAEKTAEAQAALTAEVQTRDAALADHRKQYTGMDNDIATECNSIDVLRDRLKAAEDPTYKPRFAENRDTDGMLAHCREEIRNTWNDMATFGTTLNTLATKKLQWLALTVQAARLRERASRWGALAPLEEVVVRRCFGTLTFLTKQAACGFIDPLDRDYKPAVPWKDLVAAKDREFQTAMAAAARPPEPAKPKEPAVEEEAEERPGGDAEKLMSDIFYSGILNYTRGKRYVFFGGNPQRPAAQKCREWLEQALGLQEIEWVETTGQNGAQAARLTRSLKLKPPALLLIFTQWCGHPQQAQLQEACSLASVRLVFASSSSKREICRQIALTHSIELGGQVSSHGGTAAKREGNGDGKQEG